MKLRRPRGRCSPGTLAVLVMCVVFAALESPAARAQLIPPCTLELEARLSPEVPNAKDPGFLSSLTARPGYELTWVRALPDQMAVVLHLTGPGPASNCSREVERIARDARVLRVQVLRAPRTPGQ